MEGLTTHMLEVKALFASTTMVAQVYVELALLLCLEKNPGLALAYSIGRKEQGERRREGTKRKSLLCKKKLDRDLSHWVLSLNDRRGRGKLGSMGCKGGELP